MTSPSIYMDPKYEQPPVVPERIDSYIALAVQCRQVALKFDQWMPARNYQTAAVLWFHEHKLEQVKNEMKRLKKAGMQVPEHASWKFQAPQGGTFEIVNKRPDGEQYGCTFRRDDGSETFCKIHHGYDSEEILGVKIDKFEK